MFGFVTNLAFLPRCVKLTLWNDFKFDYFMFYTYILLSKKDKKMYTGYTKNLKSRFEQHNKGLVESTKTENLLA